MPSTYDRQMDLKLAQCLLQLGELGQLLKERAEREDRVSEAEAVLLTDWLPAPELAQLLGKSLGQLYRAVRRDKTFSFDWQGETRRCRIVTHTNRKQRNLLYALAEVHEPRLRVVSKLERRRAIIAKLTQEAA